MLESKGLNQISGEPVEHVPPGELGSQSGQHHGHHHLIGNKITLLHVPVGRLPQGRVLHRFLPDQVSGLDVGYAEMGGQSTGLRALA